jgi:hypothetical protein
MTSDQKLPNDGPEGDLGTSAPIEGDASHRELEKVEAFRGVVPKHQFDVLHDLVRLQQSLRGPQTLLETAGNFNRPPFPAPLRDVSRGRR